MAKLSRRRKWSKHRILLGREELAPHLPETRLMNKKNFAYLLERYGAVIVKPDRGRRGKRVTKVFAKGDDRYGVHTENVVETMKGKITAYRCLRSLMKRRRRYLVQRCISQTRIDDCIMDFRVIVQRRSIARPWVVTAIIAKLAGPGYIVSNIARSKGTILTVDEAIERSPLRELDKATLLTELERVAIIASERLGEVYPNHRIYGYDIGIEDRGHIWIIEANHFPMMSHFRHPRERHLYERICCYKNPE